MGCRTAGAVGSMSKEESSSGPGHIFLFCKHLCMAHDVPYDVLHTRDIMQQHMEVFARAAHSMSIGCQQSMIRSVMISAGQA